MADNEEESKVISSTIGTEEPLRDILSDSEPSLHSGGNENPASEKTSQKSSSESKVDLPLHTSTEAPPDDDNLGATADSDYEKTAASDIPETSEKGALGRDWTTFSEIQVPAESSAIEETIEQSRKEPIPQEVKLDMPAANRTLDEQPCIDFHGSEAACQEETTTYEEETPLDVKYVPLVSEHSERGQKTLSKIPTTAMRKETPISAYDSHPTQLHMMFENSQRRRYTKHTPFDETLEESVGSVGLDKSADFCDREEDKKAVEEKSVKEVKEVYREIVKIKNRREKPHQADEYEPMKEYRESVHRGNDLRPPLTRKSKSFDKVHSAYSDMRTEDLPITREIGGKITSFRRSSTAPTEYAGNDENDEGYAKNVEFVLNPSPHLIQNTNEPGVKVTVSEHDSRRRQGIKTEHLETEERATEGKLFSEQSSGSENIEDTGIIRKRNERLLSIGYLRRGPTVTSDQPYLQRKMSSSDKTRRESSIHDLGNRNVAMKHWKSVIEKDVRVPIGKQGTNESVAAIKFPSLRSVEVRDSIGRRFPEQRRPSTVASVSGLKDNGIDVQDARQIPKAVLRESESLAASKMTKEARKSSYVSSRKGTSNEEVLPIYKEISEQMDDGLAGPALYTEPSTSRNVGRQRTRESIMTSAYQSRPDAEFDVGRRVSTPSPKTQETDNYNLPNSRTEKGRNSRASMPAIHKPQTTNASEFIRTQKKTGSTITKEVSRITRITHERTEMNQEEAIVKRQSPQEPTLTSPEVREVNRTVETAPLDHLTRLDDDKRWAQRTMIVKSRSLDDLSEKKDVINASRSWRRLRSKKRPDDMDSVVGLFSKTSLTPTEFVDNRTPQNIIFEYSSSLKGSDECTDVSFQSRVRMVRGSKTSTMPQHPLVYYKYAHTSDSDAESPIKDKTRLSYDSVRWQGADERPQSPPNVIFEYDSSSMVESVASIDLQMSRAGSPETRWLTQKTAGKGPIRQPFPHAQRCKSTRLQSEIASQEDNVSSSQESDKLIDLPRRNMSTMTSVTSGLLPPWFTVDELSGKEKPIRKQSPPLRKRQRMSPKTTAASVGEDSEVVSKTSDVRYWTKTGQRVPTSVVEERIVEKQKSKTDRHKNASRNSVSPEIKDTKRISLLEDNRLSCTSSQETPVKSVKFEKTTKCEENIDRTSTVSVHLPLTVDPYAGILKTACLEYSDETTREQVLIHHKMVNRFAKVLVKAKKLWEEQTPVVVTAGGINPLSSADHSIGLSTLKCPIWTTPTWEFCGNLPEPRNYHCAVYHEEYMVIVVTGGYCPLDLSNGVVLSTKSTFILDILNENGAVGDWHQGANMNHARANHSMAISDKRDIYVFGGVAENGMLTKSAERFDLEENTWNPVADLPQALMGASACSTGRRLFLVGGIVLQQGESNESASVVDTIYNYDPLNDEWNLVTFLPEPRAYTVTTIHKDEIWVIGGGTLENSVKDSDLESTRSIAVFNFQSKVWKAYHLSMSRHGMAMCQVGESCFLIGGIRSEDGEKKILQDVEIVDLQHGTLFRGPMLPTAMTGSAAVCFFFQEGEYLKALQRRPTM